MIKRMFIMLLCIGLVFGGIFGYKRFLAQTIQQSMANQKMPPAVVSTIKAEYHVWQQQIKAVGSLRAVRGVDVTSEIGGLVRKMNFKSGDEVKQGSLLVQLNADADVAQLRALEAAADLADIVYARDQKQFAVQAVSQATLDADAADVKTKRAQVREQAATVDKKAIHAPFDGRLGITTVNPGQYINPGDKIVTLQSYSDIYIDFYLPQQELSRVAVGQTINVTIDTYPDRTFTGQISTISPKVETETRNIEVEAIIHNPKQELVPGMFATAEIQAGSEESYLTVPQTCVTFNPYGETVYIVEDKGKGPDGKPALIAKQEFVTTGKTRGDQVAILKGVNEGDIVITSGQLKLKNGSPIIVNNDVQPGNDAAPKPVDQ